jgi:hypothetical protein
MEGEVLLTDWNLLFQGVLIGGSVLPGSTSGRERKGETLSSWIDLAMYVKLEINRGHLGNYFRG